MKLNYVTTVTDPWHTVCNFVNVQLSSFILIKLGNLETKNV